MTDSRTLYTTLPAVTEPWGADLVEMKRDVGEVPVTVAQPKGGRWACPECRTAPPMHDHQRRAGQRLDPRQFKTLRARAGAAAELPDARHPATAGGVGRAGFAVPGPEAATALWNLHDPRAAERNFAARYGWARRSQHRADAQGGGEDPASLGDVPDLLYALVHRRRSRVAPCQDSGGDAADPGLPHLELFPLLRTPPPPEEHPGGLMIPGQRFPEGPMRKSGHG